MVKHVQVRTHSASWLEAFWQRSIISRKAFGGQIHSVSGNYLLAGGMEFARESQRTHYLHFDYSKLEDLAPAASLAGDSPMLQAEQGLGSAV